jgi:hypothetical protein
LPAIYIVTSIYNWFLPISVSFSLAILSIGLLSFAHYFAQHWKKHNALDFLAIASALAAGYWQQGREELDYDALLYHIPMILWHQTEPVVLGLANLHNRFGFNSAWLTISSTFYWPEFGIRAIFLGQALLPMILVGFAVKQITSLGIVNLRLVFFYLAALAGLLSVPTILNTLTYSTSTDMPAMIFVIMAGFLFVSIVERTLSVPPDKSELQIELLALCSTSALAIMTKVSTAPLVIFVAALWLIGKSRHDLPKISFGIIIAPALMLALWATKNLALSGCLLFPAGTTCISTLDWSVNQEGVKQLSSQILAWARLPGDSTLSSLESMNWVSPYWERHKEQFIEFVDFWGIVVVVAILLRLIVGRFSRPLLMKITAAHWVPLVVCLAGIALWATTAPDPRFALGFFVLLPSSMAYLLFPNGDADNSKHPAISKMHMLVLTSALVSVLSLVVFLAFPPKPNNLETEFSDKKFKRRYVMVTTDYGVTILAPARGDQCGTASPPCSIGTLESLSWEPYHWLSMWKHHDKN